MGKARKQLKAKLTDADTVIADFNERYALIVVGGRTAILVEPDAGLQPEFWAKSALFDYHADHLIDGQNAAKLWFASQERRKYRRRAFDPAGTAPDIYNLFRGWPRWRLVAR